MTTIGLEVGVLVLLAVEVSTQIVVVLNQEVGLTNTNPEEVGLLGEKLVDLLIAIGIDLGMTLGIGLLLIDSG